MNPTFLDDMSWEMAEVYGAVTDRILINLAKYFPFINAGSEPRDLFEYQAKMLAQMGKVNRETVQIIAQSLAGEDEALRNCLEAAIMNALKDEEPKLRNAAQKGMIEGGGFLPPEVSPNQMQAFQAYYQQSVDKLNLVNTVMLESTQQAYAATVSDIVNRMQRTQSILNIGTGEVVSGVSSWNEALNNSVSKMIENGLTGFVDHGGHRWKPETYVAMDIRTTVYNTAREAVFERQEEYGSDLYQVSSHNGARPLCYPWQGKVISRTDNVRTVTDLDGNEVQVYAQSQTSYGEPAGLFGINCKHYPMSFFPGISRLRGEPQNPEENEKAYKESQQQRALERDLREKRRDLEVLKARNAPDEEIAKQKAKVDDADQRIRDFCDETGRTRRRSREQTPVDATWPDPETGKSVRQFNGRYEPVNPETPVAPMNPVPDAPPIVETPAPVENQTQTTPIPDPRQTTLQMYDEALGWAEENAQFEMEQLREGWQNVPSQIEAINEFEKNVPKYEQILKDAVEREEFSTRTSSGAVQKILEDGKMKSQIETGTSGGYLDIERRKRATEQLFAGSERLDISDTDYEIYGYLGNAPRTKMYGDSRIILKKSRMIERTTLTVGDSLELLETGGDPVPTLVTDPKILSYGKVFGTSVPNAPDRLKDVNLDFESIRKTGYLDGGNYVELQYHGGVTLEDIDYIEMSRSASNAADVERLAKEKGVTIRWRK